MRKAFLASVFVAMLSVAEPVRAADEFAVDGVHSSVTFKISHLGLSWIHGRFNDFSGSFVLDPEDAAKCSFSLVIKPESVDTNNQKRDEHLRAPDYFNVKQFPVFAFKSTAVKAIKDRYEVTGNLTLHGVTKPVSFTLVGGKKAEFPKGVQRVGYTTELTIKRSEFGVDKDINAIGDDVHIAISLSCAKK